MRQGYKIVMFALLFVCATSIAYTQEIVTGVVTDSSEPLPGVSVLVKGTISGTETDFDGKYSLKVKKGDVLVFSFVGMKTIEREVGNLSAINVVMQEDTGLLDEVVVVGYGTQSKKLLTDNVAKLKSQDIAGVSNANLQNALVGKASGVQITQINGKVEGGVKVIIRGLSSVNASQEPLYVIDGIEMNNTNESTQGANLNPLLSINPNDIESIDILKDASAAAIYGAKGTNGVILITTKKGKKGSSKISVNMSNGVATPSNKIGLLNAEEYVTLLKESAGNSGFFADQAQSDAWVEDRLTRYQGDQDWRSVNHDWQEDAFQSSHIRDVDVSISGGNEKTVSFFSGAYHNTKGIIRGNELVRYSFRGNVTHNVSDKFKAGFNVSYSSSEIDRIAGDNAFVTPMQAIAQIPTSPSRLTDGSPNTGTLYANFLQHEENSSRETVIKRTVGKVWGDYEIIPDLNFTSELGYDLYAQTVDVYTGKDAPFQSTNGQSFAANSDVELLSTNNYFTYDLDFNAQQNLNVIAGMTYTRSDRRATSVTGDGFPTSDFKSVSSAATISAGTGNFTAWSQLAYFARATYSYDNKYIVKGSIRRDGSSRFGVNNRFGNFWAISGAWVVSDEKFLEESSTFSNLKLRVSYGTNGNTPVNNFSNLGLYGGGSYGGESSLAYTQGENPNLKWEETSQLNLGLDFGLFNNFVTGEFDYYIKKTDDLLFNQNFPLESGLPTNASILSNIGSLENKGFETVLNFNFLRRENFTWKTSVNFSNNENELTSLPTGEVITGRNIIREGESVNAFYLVEYAGVNPDNGNARYVKNTLKADGTLDKTLTEIYSEASRVVVGSPIPNWIGGLTNTVNYKGLDFSFTFQGQWGASIYNNAGQYQEAGFGNGLDNQVTKILDRWQNPGDITNVPQLRLFRNNGHSESTRYLSEADFIRLRNVTLGYTLPKSVLDNLNMSQVRIYVTGLNLLTITNYEGYDPESTDDDANTNTNMGNSFYSAPAAKVITLGVNLTF